MFRASGLHAAAPGWNSALTPGQDLFPAVPDSTHSRFDNGLLGAVSQKCRSFSGLFRVPQFLATPSFWAIKLRTPLSFSYIKNMLKDQLFKTSGLQFDNWLFGPEQFSGLSRNRLLVPSCQLGLFIMFLLSLNCFFQIIKKSEVPVN